jgi:oxygen-independent coproporphyrinogen-3 oxidase
VDRTAGKDSGETAAGPTAVQQSWTRAARSDLPASADTRASPPGGEAAQQRAATLAPSDTKGSSLYVHIPFCVTKCHYCDFYSLPADGEPIDATVDVLLREAELRAPEHPLTVFLGGGTPSLLSEVQLQRLLRGLDGLTGFRASACEVTAECNPESLDHSKVACLLEHGVTRLSIGFQSLHEEALAVFGRAHTVRDSFAAYAAARAAGATNVNVDFIYAYPGLDSSQWRTDLARIAELRPEHVSAYNLTFEQETPFRRWLEQGRLQASSEDVELEQFWDTRAQLAAAGLHAYEISNFARSGRECEHNQRYWRNADYVGIGPSAVSHVEGTRRGNARSRPAWHKAVLEHGARADWEERLAPEQRLSETWWLGLRTRQGIEPATARRIAGLAESSDRCEQIALGLERDGFLAREGAAFVLTVRGLPLADALAKRFLAPA